MIDRDMIQNTLCGATQDVFSTMLGMEIKPGEAYVERNPSASTDGVVSLIGLAGSWSGTGSIACSAELACKICSQLLMAEFPAVNPEVLDALAEVTNMIIGNFKTVVEERLGPMGLSIPTVIFGKNFTTRSVSNEEWMIVPFLCGEERLVVKVCLARSKVQHRPVRPGFPSPYSVQG